MSEYQPTVDQEATNKFGEIFDQLLTENPDVLKTAKGRHALNVFFTQLLFCFFAEDTGIFTENQFTNAVGSHTQADGSDVADFLAALFTALDTEDPAAKPSHLAGFPYVNGRLFTVTAEQTVPRFTKKARDLLIQSGTLIWREINPDIFGSMFQAIVTPGKRRDLGQHYTSVPNILKTIEPLFLDGLKAEFDAAYDAPRKLERLLARIGDIRVFDPACGSGNFLVIAYKELRRLEHAILERLNELDQRYQMLYAESKINIENFFGIEIDDFAVEVAILSLWIAKHQMNSEFKEKFNLSIPLIPLKETGQIQVGNATRVDWNNVCPNDGGEIYLIGNPPYAGVKEQNGEQKTDFGYVFGERPFSKKLDYVALWFVKGADYIAGTRARLAFVSTKSVTQGEQVNALFPGMLTQGLEIGYAYLPFTWVNNAKRNAGVTVVVISLRNRSSELKVLFDGDFSTSVDQITGYLTERNNVIVSSRSKPLSEIPPMTAGSNGTDWGELMLEPYERVALVTAWPESEEFIRPIYGSDEFINNEERYCLWVADDRADAAFSIPPLRSRFERNAAKRLASKKESTKRLSETPYKFGELRHQELRYIIMPKVSSARRAYIPIGYMQPSDIVNRSAFAVYDGAPWLFALLTSATHMAWVRAVGGRMREDYQYSNTIVYNNFPVPRLSDTVMEQLTVAALRVLDVREYHCEKTLAELYDPDLMPDDLRAAHAQVDALVDSIYSKRGYETDEQRLADLFAMYEEMI